MTKLEKELIKSLIIGHRLSVYASILVEKLELEIDSQKPEKDKILEVLNSFSDLTFPLAVLVGADNIKELAAMIFDVRIEEEKIVDFIEEHYTDNILKSDSAPF